MYHIIDEEGLSHCSPSDAFNIHQDPAQRWHGQMAPCAARPMAAQACLSPFGVDAGATAAAFCRDSFGPCGEGPVFLPEAR